MLTVDFVSLRFHARPSLRARWQDVLLEASSHVIYSIVCPVERLKTRFNVLELLEDFH